MNKKREFVSASEAARIIGDGCSRKHIIRMAQDGWISVLRLPEGARAHIEFCRADCERLAKAARIHAARQ
jgi:hypothetical protein